MSEKEKNEGDGIVRRRFNPSQPSPNSPPMPSLFSFCPSLSFLFATDPSCVIASRRIHHWWSSHPFAFFFFFSTPVATYPIHNYFWLVIMSLRSIKKKTQRFKLQIVNMIDLNILLFIIFFSFVNWIINQNIFFLFH